MTSHAEGLPSLFLKRLENIIPADFFDEVLRSFTKEGNTSFRINTLFADKSAARKIIESLPFKVHKVPWFEDAYWVKAADRPELLDSEPYKKHYLYIQNLSSMIPVIVLDPKPGDRVLDLAAAPGSKTHMMSCLMKNEGEITAVEIVRNRFYKLKDNLSSYGVQNVTLFLGNGENVWKKYPEHFDKILIDAPCSTEARFKSYNENTFHYWSTRKIKEMVKKQNRLIYSAVRSLKVGGTMVYSTCSFAPEENEAIINRLVNKFGSSIQTETINLPLNNVQGPITQWKHKEFSEQVKKSIRILPDNTMEGFFICKIRKVDTIIE